jgi:hypothetical protein
VNDEILQKALEVAEREKQRVLDHLDGKQLQIEFGRSWQDSHVWVDGEELSVYGIDLGVDGGDMTRIEIRVAGKRLVRKIVVSGTLKIFDVEFENPGQALAEIVNSEAMGEDTEPPE